MFTYTTTGIVSRTKGQTFSESGPPSGKMMGFSPSKIDQSEVEFDFCYLFFGIKFFQPAQIGMIRTKATTGIGYRPNQKENVWFRQHARSTDVNLCFWKSCFYRKNQHFSLETLRMVKNWYKTVPTGSTGMHELHGSNGMRKLEMWLRKIGKFEKWKILTWLKFVDNLYEILVPSLMYHEPSTNSTRQCIENVWMLLAREKWRKIDRKMDFWLLKNLFDSQNTCNPPVKQLKELNANSFSTSERQQSR